MKRPVLAGLGVTIGLIATHVGTIETASAATPALKFGRWVADPSGKDVRTNAHLNRETIAVTNTTRTAITVAGYRVKDKQGHTYVFRKGTKIGAKKTVIIHTGKGTNTAGHVYWNQGNYVWNNTGDTAYLQNTKGKTVFSCAYKKTASGAKNC